MTRARCTCTTASSTSSRATRRSVSCCSARTAGGVPVRGSIALDPRTPAARRHFRKRRRHRRHRDRLALRRYAVLDRVADSLSSDGLAGLPLSSLGS